MNPRTEPLLWIQLLGLAVLPLEALLILIVLAGGDPGPAPLVEELVCWSLGALAPALLLWRTPADVWSLLVIQIPAGGRRDPQRRLSRLQDPLLLKALGPALGALLLLPLLQRLDQQAALAAPLWTSGHLPRLVALLLAALLLSVVLWQWQQWLQALWLLTRGEKTLDAAAPMGTAELERTRLCLGLPLLLPPTLQFVAAAPGSPLPAPATPVSNRAVVGGWLPQDAAAPGGAALQSVSKADDSGTGTDPGEGRQSGHPEGYAAPHDGEPGSGAR